MAHYQSHLNLHGREKRVCSACGKEQSLTRHQKGKTLNCRFCLAPLSAPKKPPETDLPRPRRRTRPKMP